MAGFFKKWLEGKLLDAEDAVQSAQSRGVARSPPPASGVALRRLRPRIFQNRIQRFSPLTSEAVSHRVVFRETTQQRCRIFDH